jgi:hypothetical protein
VINTAPVKSKKSSLVLTLADCCEQAKAFAREVRTPLFCELVPREFLVARDGEWLFEIFLECKVGLQCGGRIACWGFEFRSRDVGVRCDAFMSINDSDIYMAVQPPLDAESDDTIREWNKGVRFNLNLYSVHAPTKPHPHCRNAAPHRAARTQPKRLFLCEQKGSGSI